jgi:hypothetical protein
MPVFGEGMEFVHPGPVGFGEAGTYSAGGVSLMSRLSGHSREV